MGALLRRAILVMALLFGLLFAVGTAVLYYFGAPVQYAVLFALAVVGLQYLIGPTLIQWIFSVQWATPESLGAETAAFLRALCEKHRLPVPRVGIIEDGRPNAFTKIHRAETPCFSGGIQRDTLFGLEPGFRRQPGPSGEPDPVTCLSGG